MRGTPRPVPPVARYPHRYSDFRDLRRPGIRYVDRRRRETPARAMAAALKQLRDRDYAAELRAAGAAPVREIGVVFDGKRVRVAVRRK